MSVWEISCWSSGIQIFCEICTYLGVVDFVLYEVQLDNNGILNDNSLQCTMQKTSN